MPHAIKTRVNRCIVSHILNIGIRDRWVLIFMQLPLFNKGKSFQYHVAKKLVGPHSLCGWFRKERKESFLLQGIECQFFSRSAYSPVTIPTELCTWKLTLIPRRSRTGTVWFYTSTSNKRAARPKLYTKSLTGDLKLMYSHLTLVRISIKL